MKTLKELWNKSDGHMYGCRADYEAFWNNASKVLLVALAVFILYHGAHLWYVTLFTDVDPKVFNENTWLVLPRVLGVIVWTLAVMTGTIWGIYYIPVRACAIYKTWRYDDEKS